MSRRLSAALAAAVLLSTAACSTSSDHPDPNRFVFRDATPKGTLIPPGQRTFPGRVTGPLLDGTGTYSLESDRGHPVAINLWAQWCPPCRAETPQFQQTFLETRAQGARVVGFDVADDDQSARSYVEDNRITYPVVSDPRNAVTLQLGSLPATGPPNTVLIDKQGRVAAVYIGIVTGSQLRTALTALVAES